MRILLNILEAVEARDLVGMMAILVVPTTFGVLLWRKSPMVSSWGRLLMTMAGLSLFGWAVVVAICMFGPMPDNGFALVCGLLFGWAYAWVVGLPVLVLSFLLRGMEALVRWIVRKTMGRQSLGGMSTLGGALFLLFSMVVYPVCLCVKPAEMWKDWDGRKYRTKCVKGIVHVQIREAGETTDVCLDASSYHHFDVVPVSAECLVLKSSDVGQRFVRKVDGKWTWQADVLLP